MRRLIIVLMVFASYLYAAPEKARHEVCQIAQVERVDGRLIPQRGIRIYQLADGGLIGEYVQYGGRPFGGDTEFDDHIKAALRQVPSDIKDWTRYLEECKARVAKETGRSIGVLDGWDSRIMVDFGGTKVDIVGHNCGVYVLGLAPHDKRLAALAHLIDAIAVELGRGELAL